MPPALHKLKLYTDFITMLYLPNSLIKIKIFRFLSFGDNGFIQMRAMTGLRHESARREPPNLNWSSAIFREWITSS